LNMEEKVALEILVEDDAAAMASMIGKLYAIKRPPEYYAWHCFQSPDLTVTVGLKSRGELGGVFSMQKRRLNNDLLCGQANHLNIAAELQGKGYFSKLGEKAMHRFKDIGMVCVFANKQAKPACESSLGMKTIGIIPAMVLNVNGITDDSGANNTCKPISEDTVFPSCQEDKDIIMFKYLSSHRSWRYAKHPMYSYYIVYIDSGEYAIIKKFSDPQTRVSLGDIVDLECPLNDKEKLHKIIKAASWHLKQQGVSTITCWAVPGGVVNQVMKDIGFRPAGHETYFCIKVLRPEYDHLCDFSRWHLRMADATNY